MAGFCFTGSAPSVSGFRAKGDQEGCSGSLLLVRAGSHSKMPAEASRGSRDGRCTELAEVSEQAPGRQAQLYQLWLFLEFLPPLLPDCEEQLRCTPCSGVEGDLSEEWSDPFSTMVSPSGLCGVGERDRFRRTGEQAGELRLELLAVLARRKNSFLLREETW